MRQRMQSHAQLSIQPKMKILDQLLIHENQPAQKHATTLSALDTCRECTHSSRYKATKTHTLSLSRTWIRADHAHKALDTRQRTHIHALGRAVHALAR